MNDNFFSDPENIKPFFKCAINGFAGDGKTYTATLLAIGLHQRIESKKPVVVFDTERAMRQYAPLFKEAKVPVKVKEGFTLTDLAETMKRVADGYAEVLMIDSLTTIWNTFLESYLQKYQKKEMALRDWNIVKPIWQTQVSRRAFIFDPYHCIGCGRAGFTYDSEINERGKREFFIDGVKMKAEAETQFEPDLTILMERVENVLGLQKEIFHQAVFTKDRSAILDGKIIRNPTYNNIAPVVEWALTGGKFKAVGLGQSDNAVFKTDEDKFKFKQEVKILLERIEGEMVKAWPGTTAEMKKAKVEALEKAFGTTSWTAVEAMSPESLHDGLEKIKEITKEKK